MDSASEEQINFVHAGHFPYSKSNFNFYFPTFFIFSYLASIFRSIKMKNEAFYKLEAPGIRRPQSGPINQSGTDYFWPSYTADLLKALSSFRIVDENDKLPKTWRPAIDNKFTVVNFCFRKSEGKSLENIVRLMVGRTLILMLILWMNVHCRVAINITTDMPACNVLN